MQSIRSFVSRDSPHYAELLIRRLVAAVDRLRSFPTSGRVVPEFGDASLREVVWRNYRIVYRRVGRQVVILTVFHGSLPFPGTS
ncbi:MAG: type II toxin-antitoxin system RelE/ParE family toxin [bacterium]|nr:type II toxin-antitoxin system RelE/ParE family toxin [bacterium]